MYTVYVSHYSKMVDYQIYINHGVFYLIFEFGIDIWKGINKELRTCFIVFREQQNKEKFTDFYRAIIALF